MYNANNYGYNPYGTYLQPRQIQPIQQPMQQVIPVQQNNLNGKQVESIDVVKATDIPLDGSISYFPLLDGSAIITKQLQMDGTSKIITFKPFTEQKDENKYITQDDMKKAFKEYKNDDLEDIKDEIKELKQELKELKKKKKED